jgi:hypothetical protein
MSFTRTIALETHITHMLASIILQARHFQGEYSDLIN